MFWAYQTNRKYYNGTEKNCLEYQIRGDVLEWGLAFYRGLGGSEN